MQDFDVTDIAGTILWLASEVGAFVTGAAFQSIMRETSVPLHQRHGNDVASFGNSPDDLDCYYLIRAFDMP